MKIKSRPSFKSLLQDHIVGLNPHENYKFVDFELLFGKKSERNPSEILLGLKVNLLPKWKIYWRNPGDAGLPPEINFNDANNIK